MRIDLKIRIVILLFILYILIITASICIAKIYPIGGFKLDGFSAYKLVSSTGIFLVLFLFYSSMKSEFFRIVFSTYIILINIGQSVNNFLNNSNLSLRRALVLSQFNRQILQTEGETSQVFANINLISPYISFLQKQLALRENRVHD